MVETNAISPSPSLSAKTEAVNGRLFVLSLFLPFTVTRPQEELFKQQVASALSFKASTSLFKSKTTPQQPAPHKFPVPSTPSGKVRPQHSRSISETFHATDGSSWVIESSSLGNVGLHNAVHSVFGKDGEPLADVRPLEKTWVGAVGHKIGGLSKTVRDEADKVLRSDKYNCIPLWIQDDVMDGAYSRASKGLLWRTFHYQLPMSPHADIDESQSWQHYVAVNQMFADAVAAQWIEGDVIWVHDYHLMLVPSMLRKLLPSATIGFFLHVPFPSSEIFRCLPTRKQILEGLLGADLIGFQTYSFLRHFLLTVSRVLGYESSPRGVLLENTVVSVGIFPIGINLRALTQKLDEPEVSSFAAVLQNKYHDKKLIVGRDKNDGTKGIKQKLLAFDKFLERYPEWRGKAILVQVSLHTLQNSSHITELIKDINSRWGNIEYQPVVYLYQDLDFMHYIALLSIADAFLVTSLRDGMNLTSHEYVVCQSKKKSPLIISEFAGTYTSFGCALRVNPYHTVEVACAINEALTMSTEEKEMRWKELYSVISANTGHTFVRKYLTELLSVHRDVQRRFSIRIPHVSSANVVQKFASEEKGRRVLFLDDIGTLILSRDDSNQVRRLKEVLTRLCANEKNVVYLMSGETRASLKDYERIPGLGISAENGIFLKRAGSNEWETMLSDSDLSWRERVLEMLEYYTDRTFGSRIETKEVAITWHYESSDINFGLMQAHEAMNHVADSLGSGYPVHALAKARCIEIVPKHIHKGVIVRRVLEELGSDAGFVFCVGDDRSDEDMFEYLEYLHDAPLKQVPNIVPLPASVPGFARARMQADELVLNMNSPEIKTPENSEDIPEFVTCTVGSKSTKARYFVTGYLEVLEILNKFIQLGTGK